jgi:hypothetical protein
LTAAERRGARHPARNGGDAALYAAKAGGCNRVTPPPLRADPPARRAAATG